MRYARPAIHIERLDALGPGPIVLRTDVAGLVGIARRGPLDTPVPVESMRQFTAHFGEFTGTGYLAYAVRGFFENGGRRCWVVRAANRDDAGGARYASVLVDDVEGRPALRVAASSAGSWGNALGLEWALESGPAEVGRPAGSDARQTGVPSTAGFAARQLVRIDQPGHAPVYRVVSAVDPEHRRLYWVHPEPQRRQPSDRPLAGLDLSQPLRITKIAYSLTVREGGRVRKVYRDLHLVPTHERFVARVLDQPDYRPWWVATGGAGERHAGTDAPHSGPGRDLPRAAEPVVVRALLDADAVPAPLALPASDAFFLAGGVDGLAALSIDDFIGEPVEPADSDFVRLRKLRGLQALAAVDEIAIVAMPDLLIRPEPDPVYEVVAPPAADPCRPCPPPAPRQLIHQPLRAGDLAPAFPEADIARGQAALLAHCEALGDRFAVLSLPYRLAAGSRGSREALDGWRKLFDSRYGALYAPWVEVLDPRRSGTTRTVPACGHLLGAIARTDLSFGVQRAPANLPVLGVTDLSRQFDDDDHGELNLSHVNVLRAEFGRPPTLAGARSLSFDPLWRFVSVVRLVLVIRKAVDIALRWAVFEPNSATTRAAVAATLTGLLQGFFERGAFRGATPQESYFVRCDEVTTPREARDAGELVALVGIAPAAPCEFIVLRVGRERDAIAVTLFGEAEAVHA